MTPGPLDDELRRTFDRLSDRLRSGIAEHLSSAADDLAAVLAAEHAAANARAAEQAQAAAQSLQEARAASEALEEARVAAEEAARAHVLFEQEVTARFAAQVASAEEQARRAGQAEGLARARDEIRTSERAAADRLLDGVRAIDRAGSLSEILDTLATCAAVEASRVALLLSHDDTLRGWRFVGFDQTFDRPADVVVSLDHAGAAADAVRDRVACVCDTGSAPAFARSSDVRPATAIPILLSGQTVAVLYADQATDGGAARPSWSAMLEILARHAARAVEAVTALRTAQALTDREFADRTHR